MSRSMMRTSILIALLLTLIPSPPAAEDSAPEPSPTPALLPEREAIAAASSNRLRAR